MTGTVTAIELRKTRFRNAEGEIMIVANRDVEKKWTKLRDDIDADAGVTEV